MLFSSLFSSNFFIHVARAQETSVQEKRVDEQKEFLRQQKLNFDQQVDAFKEEREHWKSLVESKDVKIAALEAQVTLFLLRFFWFVLTVDM